jgi:cyanophycinase
MTDRERLGQGGHLVIIGGGEDREHDMEILTRFVALSGGPERRIAVITAASRVPDDVWAQYDAAFGELGVADRLHIHIASREGANDPATIERLARAGGIFMSGGDQKRLLALIGGTALDRELHRAYTERGACIGGTSAGASAMSQHMLAEGQAKAHPAKGTVHLGAGLGLVQRIVIDQHFSERQRLPRLLTVVAQNPLLQGVGIDEDTALVIARGAGIEVIGAGTVTVLDGRSMHSNLHEINRYDCPELIDVRLHLLPSGAQYKAGEPGTRGGEAAEGATPQALRDFVDTVAAAN